MSRWYPDEDRVLYFCDECGDELGTFDSYDIGKEELCKSCAFKKIYTEDIGNEFMNESDDEEIMRILNMTREEASEYEPLDFCWEKFDEFFGWWLEREEKKK